MRRWLAIFLLILLPVQFTWAAAEAYCGHERGDGVQHLGHHAHQHEAGSADASTPEPADAQDGGATGFHADCGHCHGHGSALTVAGPETGPRVTSSYGLAAADAFLRTRAESPPDRPQWRCLA